MIFASSTIHRITYVAATALLVLLSSRASAAAGNGNTPLPFAASVPPFAASVPPFAASVPPFAASVPPFAASERSAGSSTFLKWVLGQEGRSCTESCKALGQTCKQEKLDELKDEGGMKAALTAAGVTCTSTNMVEWKTWWNLYNPIG